MIHGPINDLPPIRLYNTMGRTEEIFTPIEPAKVRMYTCGPTVYHFAHIGNLRSFLTADILRRVLEYNGYHVTQVKNITDVGHLRDDVAETGADRMEAAAREEGATPQEIASFYTEAYVRDEALLNIIPPSHRPKATDFIPQMIEFTEHLIEKGFAYVAGGNVYFDVGKFPSYGALSGNRLDDLVAGQRVDIEPDKHNPADFALWKAGDQGRLMNWESPWGPGFPGWHIECSAMATTLLGDQIDIHTGGIDNLFPHHEDERAQSEAVSGKEFVRYWAHGAHLLFGEEKMSKSLGNIATLSELIDRGVHPLAFRYFLLQGHYRKQIAISDEALDAAATGLDRIWDQAADLWQSERGAVDEDRVAALRAGFVEAINDDLATPRALVVLQNVLESALSPASKLVLLEEMDRVFGLDLLTMAKRRSTLTDEQAGLIEDRRVARLSKDWQRSDTLRDELLALGVEVRDAAGGQRWIRRD